MPSERQADFTCYLSDGIAYLVFSNMFHVLVACVIYPRKVDDQEKYLSRGFIFFKFNGVL